MNASNYLVVNQSTPFVAGKWYSIGIPIADFGAIDPYIQGVVFQSTVADDVWVDDVVFTSPIVLKWPLGGNNITKTISGYHFNVNWDIPTTDCPSGVWKLHTGVDYTASVGDNVYAAESGVVKHVEEHNDAFGNIWAYHIVLEHITSSGQKFTTVYWHVTPVAGLDGFVGPIAKGQKIATVADISTGAHLHFGVWLGDYATFGENGPATA